MPDANKVLSRLTNPGTIILLVGAVAVYMSAVIARKCTQDEAKQMKVSIAIKAAGCLVALLGTLMLFFVKIG